MRSRLLRRRLSRQRPLLLCLALALGLHVLLAASVRSLIAQRSAAKRPVAPIRMMDQARTQAAIARARRKQAESAQKRPQEPKDERGRIVSLPTPARPVHNDTAALLAKDAHRTNKPTVSRERELSDKPAALHKEEGQAARAPQDLPQKKSPSPQTAAPATPEQQKAAARLAQTRGRKPRPLAAEVANGQQQKAAPPRRVLGLSDLMPSVAQLARAGGAPVADVSRDDAPEGDVTALNTRSFRFAGFFERVSQKLRPHWHIYEALAQVRKRGAILLEHETYKTTVHVVLDERGQLVSAAVRNQSGVSEFDAAGKGAIEEAAPYLHPPQGLLDDSRQVTFDFEFLVSAEPGNMFDSMHWRQDLP